MYSKKLTERFRNPRYSGEMKNPDAIGEEGNVKCGDVMKIYLKVGDNRIKDVSFQTYGCMAAIASSDAMCELIKGKKIEEVEKITAKQIVEKLGGMPPVKQHCSVLGTQALKKAIENYKNLHRK